MTTLMVGTAKGVFVLESDSDRREWELRGPYHKGWQAYASTIHDGVLWSGLSNMVFGTHVQHSRDGGRTWTAMENGPAFEPDSARKLTQVWKLAPAHDGTMLAGVAEAALFEQDGERWTLNEGLESHKTRDGWQPGAGGLCLHAIIPDPKKADRIFIGVSAVGVFRSDDRGQTWDVKNEGVTSPLPDERIKYTEINRCVHGMVQDPVETNLLYQQNHTGVYRSEDAGDTWERIENGLSSRFGFPIVMHPRERRTLYVIPQESDEFRLFPEGRPAVYRTRDGGEHWERLDRGLAKPNYGGVLRGAMAADRADPLGIYFGTTSGELYASTDEGESFRRLPGTYPRILSVALG